jgi:glycosyltransferase involved in cell wall biosynthesis
MPPDTVTVVIPSYNMDWCIARAIESCQAQSLAPEEIIVVDDCSADHTEAIISKLMITNPTIKYFRLGKNRGHLAALKFGAEKAATDWVALLDADDELTPNSIEARVVAANAYMDATGVKPQLVYGDLEGKKFTRLRGYAFPYLCKELCLCQTSTIMLGRECISHIPVKDTYNTDDEIVLAISQHYHILHSSAIVTIYHSHNSPTRMSSNARKVFDGVCDLVRTHRADIVREHGIGRLLLWWLRILKTFVRYQVILTSAQIAALPSTFAKPYRRFLLRVYRRCLTHIDILLKSFLGMHFEHDLF